MSTDPVRDAAARARALDPRRSFLVQAPAGSGKTELLIQRFLTLLATVEEPEAILAITFTRKAAGEMRARILDALSRAAGPEPDSSHARLTWRLARVALERDGERGWNLRENPVRLRIQTIDSLCAAITRQMPWMARFGAMPDVADEPEVWYAEAARRTLRLLTEGGEYSEAVRCLLQHLDNRVDTAAELLADLLTRRDQWLRYTGSGVDFDPAVVRQQLEQALCRVISRALEHAQELVPSCCQQELVALARYAAANLQQEGASGPLLPCRQLLSLPGTQAEDLAAWLGLAHLLLTGEGEWRERISKTIGFPGASGIKDRAAKALAQQMNERCKALLEQLQGEATWQAALTALRQLPAARFSDGQWELLRALLILLPMAAAQLMEVFRDQGEVDFAAISQAALRALGDEDDPTDLGLSMGCRLQHLMIDEFQDTSVTQYSLLRSLTAGWEAGEDRTVFLVGDPMQSIYRFRQAEVGLFLQSREQGIGAVTLEPLVLEVNFRSQGGVVAWVNETFAQVFPQGTDIRSGAVPYSASVAFHPALAEEPSVQVHPCFGPDYAAEAEQVVALVKQAEGRTAILVRARPHLQWIAAVLRREDVPFRAVEIDSLAERSIIYDLLALTRALLHLADREAWVSVLRAPWCGLSLADLHTLAADDHHATVWDLLRRERTVYTPEGARQVARIRAVLAAALAERRQQPLRPWVEGTWLALGGPACVRDETAWRDAEAYFTLLEQWDDGGDCKDLDRLSEAVSRLYAQPEAAADAPLSIMTMHKAKGLEFDTVILPGLGRPPRPESRKLLLWQEVAEESETALLLAPVAPTGESSDPIYAYLRILEREKTRHEAVRLLYVGATRAKRKLHLLGHVAGADAGALRPASGSLLELLWPVIRAAYETAPLPLAEPVPVTPAERQPVVIRRLPAEWVCPAPPPSVTWEPLAVEEVEGRTPVEAGGPLASDLARHAGTVVHALLERMARQGLAAWSPARVQGQQAAIRAMLASLGLPEAELESGVARAVQAVQATLQCPRGRWILSAHSQAANEFPLSGVVQGKVYHVLIDRTFVDENGTRWIIDYKTSEHEGSEREAFLDEQQALYEPVLARYAELMATHDARPVQVGLYFPLLSAWREWPAVTSRQAVGSVGR